MNATADDVLTSPEAGGRVIRGSAWRGGTGGLVGVGTAALLLRHLGVAESGRYPRSHWHCSSSRFSSLAMTTA